MKCQNCGAEVSGRYCEFCGTRITQEMLKEQEQINKSGCAKCGSTNISFHRENQGEVRGKNYKNVVHRTVGICKDCGYTWYTDSPTPQQPKKRKTWLWVLGWIFIFPVPLTILMLRKKQLNPIVKYGVIVAVWLLYLIIGASGNSDSSSTTPPNESSVPTVSSVQVETTKETNKADNRQSEAEQPIPNDEPSAQIRYIRDETLKGHGHSGSGRSEPQNVGIIGYAVDSASSGVTQQ